VAWNIIREICRKTVHLLGFALLAAYLFILHHHGEDIALMFLVGMLGLLLILEFFRLDLETKIPFIDFLIRPKELNRINSSIYFIIGMTIAFSVFEFAIALTAVLMTIFGDMVAGIVGQNFGHNPIFGHKTMAGTLAGLATNIFVGFIFLGSGYIVIPIAMAIVASLTELFVDQIDDNLVITLFAGFVGQLLLSL